MRRAAQRLLAAAAGRARPITADRGFTSIPVIDVSPLVKPGGEQRGGDADRQLAVAQQLHTAAKDVGFFNCKNAGRTSYVMIPSQNFEDFCAVSFPASTYPLLPHQSVSQALSHFAPLLACAGALDQTSADAALIDHLLLKLQTSFPVDLGADIREWLSYMIRMSDNQYS